MGNDSFLAALLLVAVAQVPLLLKLWFDYRSKTNTYKQNLFSKQLEFLPKLGALLEQVHMNCISAYNLFQDGSLKSEEQRREMQDLFTSFLKTHHKLFKISQRWNILLPASTAVALSEYLTPSSRVLTFTYAPSLGNGSVEEEWQKENTQFNLVYNQLRLCCGTDALSKDTITEFTKLSKDNHSLIIYKTKS